MRAMGVGSSSARAWSPCCMRAIAQARMTPMSVSDARAYTAEGMIQMARSRQPGADASAFMARLIAMQVTFSARGRMARLPCRARAMPSAAKISAPMSGMPASRAAIAGACLTSRTRTYCASQLTAAAAAARAASAVVAVRSQACARSWCAVRWQICWLCRVHAAGCRGADVAVVVAALPVPADRVCGGRRGFWGGVGEAGELARQVLGSRQRLVENLVEQVADAAPAQQGELAQAAVDAAGQPRGQPRVVGLGLGHRGSPPQNHAMLSQVRSY